ncbi:hypothetical protein ANCDUO_09711 [Ancylostoma duodenale]|uniref:Uncharacterized protein n=1 Tax=Ancylostoma duodenale TaxID=51022 RepID=A0A0C2GFW8_9BILA|nr:hypothetical protein ANCDUO_09711 [Ancylostoma duodenale]
MRYISGPSAHQWAVSRRWPGMVLRHRLAIRVLQLIEPHDSESPARSVAGGSSCGESERSLTTPPLPPALKHNPSTSGGRKSNS